MLVHLKFLLNKRDLLLENRKAAFDLLANYMLELHFWGVFVVMSGI